METKKQFKGTYYILRYKKYIERIREAKTDKEIAEIIDAVYEEGFDDGQQEEPLSSDPEPMFDPCDLD